MLFLPTLLPTFFQLFLAFSDVFLQTFCRFIFQCFYCCFQRFNHFNRFYRSKKKRINLQKTKAINDAGLVASSSPALAKNHYTPKCYVRYFPVCGQNLKISSVACSDPCACRPVFPQFLLLHISSVRSCLSNVSTVWLVVHHAAWFPRFRRLMQPDSKDLNGFRVGPVWPTATPNRDPLRRTGNVWKVLCSVCSLYQKII